MKRILLWLATACFALSSARAQTGPVQWTGPGSNGHYYEIKQATGTNVPAYGGLSWTEANYLATAAGGYLATITSAAENSFVAALLESSPADRAYLGGTDSATEGVFKWAGGPEAGANFSFTSWNSGEPNNSTQTYIASGGPANPEGEDYAEMYSSRINNALGKWNDLPNNGTPGIAFVVEYDATAFTVTNPAGPSGLVSWWRGESNTLDSVGGHHGVGTALGYAPGAVGQAFTFGSAGNLTVPNPPFYAYSNGFTVAAWIYRSANVSTAPCVINNRSATNNDGFTLEQLFNNPGTMVFAVNQSGGTEDYQLVSSSGWELNTFYHVTATFDAAAGTMALYRNGVLVAVTNGLPHVPMVIGPADPFEIGQNINAPAFHGPWPGLIDDVRFYNRALSGAEITTLATGNYSGPRTWDLKTDWSDSANPNGVWSYREGNNLLPHMAWVGRTEGTSTNAQPAWSKSEDGTDRLPLWFRSLGSETFAHDWQFGDIAMHSTDDANGVGNGIGNVIWTSPMTGTIKVSGNIWPGRDIGRSNHWAIYLNQSLITSGDVASGDPFSRTNPMSFASGAFGTTLNGLNVVPGDVLKLEISRASTLGDFAGVNLTVTQGASISGITNPVVQLACTNSSPVTVPIVSGPFMNLVSEGRISNGAYGFGFVFIFNTDNGILYQSASGNASVLDSSPRRIMTQADGSEVMLFEFTSLSFVGASVIVKGHRAAALLATGDIYFDQCALTVEAGGDPGGMGGTVTVAGSNAPAPFGGGGAIGTPDGYVGGDAYPCCPGYLPTSGAGGGGFVSPGGDGFPARPSPLWGAYNGSGWPLLGYVDRPGGTGGLPYTNFSVLRGGGGGGGNSPDGHGYGGWKGGNGGGALLISTPGTIQITKSSSLRADGSSSSSDPFYTFAGGGAGGYLVLIGGKGILNQGIISASGGPGGAPGNPLGWGNAGPGSGGLIVLKSAAGITNNGTILSDSGAGPGVVCTAGAVQPQAPFYVTPVGNLTAPAWQNNQFTFTLQTVPNTLYQIQRNDDLTTTNWIAFTNVLGNGLPTNIIVPVPGVPQRFFRVREQ